MDKSSKISIIVPVFNVRDYIERCACSLFEQTLKDLEYIFVDDASQDDSVEILKSCIERYPKRGAQVKILTHKSNHGPSAARNAGLAVAGGEYVAFCDSDDYVDRNMYEKLYDTAKQTNADLVYCDFYFKYKGDKVEKYHAVSAVDKDSLLRAYIGSGWTVLWNMIAKKNIYERYKLLLPDGLTYCEDFHLSLRLFYYSNVIVKVDTPLYYYNQENNSSIMRNRTHKQARDERVVYSEIIDFFRRESVLEEFQREMAWRVLKNKQDLVLNVKEHTDFMAIHPWSHEYIMSCPKSFCNRKIKIMMWMLTHHFRFILLPILWFRRLKNR